MRVGPLEEPLAIFLAPTPVASMSVTDRTPAAYARRAAQGAPQAPAPTTRARIGGGSRVWGLSATGTHSRAGLVPGARVPAPPPDEVRLTRAVRAPCGGGSRAPGAGGREIGANCLRPPARARGRAGAGRPCGRHEAASGTPAGASGRPSDARRALFPPGMTSQFAT